MLSEENFFCHTFAVSKDEDSKKTSPGRPPKLNDELIKNIADLVRAGAYPWVAAAAYKVPLSTYHEWMMRGEGRHSTRKPTPLTRLFAERINEAHAVRRALAEAAVVSQNPLQWLRHVARDKPQMPGWSDDQQLDSGESEAAVIQLVRSIREESA